MTDRHKDTSEKLKEFISAVIQQQLSTRGWTYKEFARKIGVSVNSVSLYVRRKSEPSIGTLFKIEDVFELEHGDILQGYQTLEYGILPKKKR